MLIRAASASSSRIVSSDASIVMITAAMDIVLHIKTKMTSMWCKIFLSGWGTECTRLRVLRALTETDPEATSLAPGVQLLPVSALDNDQQVLGLLGFRRRRKESWLLEPVDRGVTHVHMCLWPSLCVAQYLLL